jgi:hypothetical protein
LRRVEDLRAEAEREESEEMDEAERTLVVS